MSRCDEILRHGVFETIIVNSQRTFSENYVEWLKSATIEQMRSKASQGLKIGFPIEGVPIEFSGNVTDEQYKQWRQAIDSGKVRSLTEQETTQVIQTSASKAIVEAWRACVLNEKGLSCHTDIGSHGEFVLFFGYVPNSQGDKPPTATGDLILTNAQAMNPLKKGQPIPYAGVSVQCIRTLNAQYEYPEASYVLNTTKGSTNGTIEALSSAKATPKIRSIKLFHATGDSAAHPTAQVSVPSGWKMVGGGARVNWSGMGSLMFGCYPSDEKTWRAHAKDHAAASPANIDVWAIGIEDPKDEWEVRFVHETSDSAEWPTKSVTVPEGFSLVGGGALTHWAKQGLLLTESFPIDSRTWRASAKDHIAPEAGTLEVFAIGLRPRNGSAAPEVIRTVISTAAAQHPNGECQAPSGTLPIAGGVKANWKTQGSLLTASYPTTNGWAGASKDHQNGEAVTLDIACLSIPRKAFA